MYFLRGGCEGAIPELNTIEECDLLFGNDLAVIFKHSPTCPMSMYAHREVVRFIRDRPETPIYLISVRSRREIARHITDKTGVQHESPQVLVLRNGSVIASASHGDITTAFLKQTSNGAFTAA